MTLLRQLAAKLEHPEQYRRQSKRCNRARSDESHDVTMENRSVPLPPLVARPTHPEKHYRHNDRQQAVRHEQDDVPHERELVQHLHVRQDQVGAARRIVLVVLHDQLAASVLQHGEHGVPVEGDVAQGKDRNGVELSLVSHLYHLLVHL